MRIIDMPNRLNPEQTDPETRVMCERVTELSRAMFDMYHGGGATDGDLMLPPDAYVGDTSTARRCAEMGIRLSIPNLLTSRTSNI